MSKDDPKLQAALLELKQTDPPTISEADYEQMYKLLYAYRFGSIGFLELLGKLETILHINSSQASRQADPD